VRGISKDKFIEATHKSFEEKGYHVIPGSLTVYGDKPLFEGYFNFLEKVIIPTLSEFPTEREFEDN
jgi:2C-methyl-D-erythritol 2,4-cyclodiphosphate synthase